METYLIINEDREVEFSGTRDECESHFLIELDEGYKVISAEHFEWQQLMKSQEL